jgi:hypothetical protein
VHHPHSTHIDFSMFIVENVSLFELQSVQIFDLNLAIQLIKSKQLKVTKAILIIEFYIVKKLFDQFWIIYYNRKC